MRIFLFFVCCVLADEYTEVKEGKAFMYKNTIGFPYPVRAPANLFFNIPDRLDKNGDTVCFIGDTGSGEIGQKQAAELLTLHSYPRTSNPCKQIRHLGDIIYVKGVHDTKNLSEINKLFLPYYEHRLYRGAPDFYLLMGNHDYYGNIEVWFKMAQKYPALKFPYYYYAENFNGLCLVSMDSNPFFEQGFPMREQSGQGKPLDSPRYHSQINWFNSIKGQLNNCKLKIFLAHHPLYAPSGRNLAGKIGEFYNQEIFGQFDVFIAGHDHLLAYMGSYNGRVPPKRTALIISGGGGKKIRNEVMEESIKFARGNSIPWLEFKPGLVKMVIKRVGGKVGASFVGVINGRTMPLLTIEPK